MYGDTVVLRGLAQRMEDQAREIRREAEDLVRCSNEVLWSGRAAEAMRQRMRERAGALRATAAEHEDAGAALRAHADRVDAVKARIDSIARRVQWMVEDATSRMATLVRDRGAAGRDLLLEQVDEILLGFRPPPPGHRDWLEVPDRLPGVSR